MIRCTKPSSLITMSLLSLALLISPGCAKKPGADGYINSEKGLPLRESPSFEARMILLLPHQAPLRIIRTDGPAAQWRDYKGNWYQVEYQAPNGELQQGWSFSPFIAMGKPNGADSQKAATAKDLSSPAGWKLREAMGSGTIEVYFCDDGKPDNGPAVRRVDSQEPIFEEGRWKLDSDGSVTVTFTHQIRREGYGPSQNGPRGPVYSQFRRVESNTVSSQHFNVKNDGRKQPFTGNCPENNL